MVGPNLPDENGDPGTVKPVPILAGIHQTVGPLEEQVAHQGVTYDHEHEPDEEKA